MKIIVRLLLVAFLGLIITDASYAYKNLSSVKSTKTEIKSSMAGCAPGASYTDLWINNVRCRINTGGDMWWDLQGVAKYFIPGNTAKTSMFSAALWIGGLDVNGQLSEGSGENVFVVVDGVIYTPPLSASILGGITRRFAITLAQDLGYEVREQNIVREMLYAADEVFFTGTAAEITPIKSIDKLPVGAGSRGPITKSLQDEFFAILRSEKPDRHGWLTPVNG